MDRERVGRPHRRRRGLIATLAALLVLGGLVLATTAPAGPSANNKLDAYGGPTVPKPTNPTSKSACDKYYGGASNQSSDVRSCRAIATYNIAIKACAKKSGAKKTKCIKAAKRARAKTKAKIAKQVKAEKACNDAYIQTTNALQEQQAALDPSAPDYAAQDAALSTQFQQASETNTQCLKKAQA